MFSKLLLINYVSFVACKVCLSIVYYKHLYWYVCIGAKRVGVSGEYGNGNTDTPIHLSNLQCTGNESEIYFCVADVEPTGCTHENDVSVECLRK